MALHDELATLCHGAERANLQPMARLSSLLQGVYGHFINGEVAANSQSYATLLAGHNELMNIVDAIAAGQDLPQPSEDILQRLQALTKIDLHVAPIDDPNSASMHDNTD